MDNMLEINHLNKKYGDFTLDDINFKLPKGQILGFIGENGAGKSTTIKSILNLIRIDSGSITVLGKKHDKLTRQEREEIGVVLDDGFLPEQLSYEDIRLIIKNIYPKWDDQLFYEYIKRFKLPKNKTIKEYSSGMKMKIKLIVALCHHPRLLILDEPTSGLDPVARYEVLDILEEFIKDENHAILISSHITSDLEHIADNILFIHEGRIILEEKKDILMNVYGIIRMSEEEIKKIDNNDYIKYLRYKDECLLLTKDKKYFKSKYKEYEVERPTIENIMLVYMKGKTNA